MQLSRRDFLRLAALSLGLGVSGLPRLAAAESSGLIGTLDKLLPLHPLLQLRGQATPNTAANVIVQTLSVGNVGNIGATLAAAGGGTLLGSFPFVNAYALRLPLGNLARLARRLDILFISPDAPMRYHAAPAPDPAQLNTTYPRTIQATDAWQQAQTWGGTGAGVAVAVLDSGLTLGPDFGANTLRYNLNPRAKSADDPHGHGTHVAGIIKGRSASGAYVGVAPDATLISLKIGDDTGMAQASDLLRGLQWVYDRRNGVDGSGPIKVVSLSVSTAIPESYLTSAICAAVERLWNAGIVVVSAAGNRGSDRDATWYPPANDPFVISVGATDENGSGTVADDVLASFSSRGRTQDLIVKPDIVAPGRRIVSTLAAPNSLIAQLYPERLADGGHIRLSGTSMAAPVVAGAVAILRGRFPQLTPDQIKWLLTTQGRAVAGSANAPSVALQQAATWAANTRNTVGRANKGLLPSLGIALPLGGLGFVQGYWDQGYWDQGYWDQGYWDQGYWDGDLAED